MLKVDIRKKREELNLSQKALARALNVTPSFLSKVESKTKKIPKKFNQLIDLFYNLDLISYALSGISNLYSHFPFHKFNIIINNSSSLLEEFESWCTVQKKQIISQLSAGKLPSLIDNQQRKILNKLALLSPEFIYSNDNLFFYSLNESQDGCICIHVDDDLSWYISFYPIAGYPVRLSGCKDDLIFLYLAFKFNSPHGKISICKEEGFLRFYNIQLFSLELEPIEKIVNKYISSKKLDIPIFLRTSL